jgi:hypothetical protein
MIDFILTYRDTIIFLMCLFLIYIGYNVGHHTGYTKGFRNGRRAGIYQPTKVQR